jgi:hypothetical protein
VGEGNGNEAWKNIPFSSSTVVEHLPHHSKVKGSNLAPTTGTRSEKFAKRYLDMSPGNGIYKTSYDNLKILLTLGVS